MDRFARVILGYHGCHSSLAMDLVSGNLAIADWPVSRNAYDWLGHGIYFWEHGPERAREWSLNNGGDGSVVGAVIPLSGCLDFTDTYYTDLLADAYQAVQETYAGRAWTLPKNRKGKNELDCVVINRAVLGLGDGRMRFQTVRSPFLEGPAAFPGSAISRQSHIQVSVVDPACIRGVFLPNVD